MNQETTLLQLENIRHYFLTGATKSEAFRRAQLLALKAAVVAHEQDIYAALHADLKKNREETFVTENGFLLTEINYALRHLTQWMQPERVATNLVNLPSKSRIIAEPLGVALIIGPWNYPFQLLLTPLVGAIAAGNCAVLKPSEFAPATAAIMKQIIETTFDKNYIFYVEGDGAEVVPAMLKGFRFDHVFYTGSTSVGKEIYKMAAEKLVPVTLELGGKSPCIVAADADIKVAAKRIAMTKFNNAGQTCVAPDYVLVHDSVKEEFLREMIATIKTFFTDDPSQSYSFGKIINERQFNRLVGYLKDGRIVHGGRHNIASLYLEPTILADVTTDTAVMNEEIFGPVLPVLSFNNFETARALVLQHADPLAFYIFTASKTEETRWLNAVPSGGACVNNCSWHLTNMRLPFGGRGQSGLGAYHGQNSFNTFSHKKAVLRTPTWFDPAIKYPPFNGRLGLFKWLIR